MLFSVVQASSSLLSFRSAEWYVLLTSIFLNCITLLPNIFCHPLHRKAAEKYCLYFVDLPLHFPFALQTTPQSNLASSSALCWNCSCQGHKVLILPNPLKNCPRVSLVRERKREFDSADHCFVLKFFSFLSFLYNILSHMVDCFRQNSIHLTVICGMAWDFTRELSYSLLFF